MNVENVDWGIITAPLTTTPRLERYFWPIYRYEYINMIPHTTAIPTTLLVFGNSLLKK